MITDSLSDKMRVVKCGLSTTEEVLLKGWRYASNKEWELASIVWKTIPDNEMTVDFYSALYLVSRASDNYPDIVFYSNKVKGIGANNNQFNSITEGKEAFSAKFGNGYHQKDPSFYLSAMSPEKLQKYIKSLHYYGFVDAAESVFKRALEIYPNEKKMFSNSVDRV